MPELPDITLYLDAMHPRIVGQPLRGVRLAGPALVKTLDPPLEASFERLVVELRRMGKRIGIGLEGNLWLVLHLMTAGRLLWAAPDADLPGRSGQAAFDFPNGALLLTEAGPRNLTALWVVKGADLAQHKSVGLEPLVASQAEFVDALRSENHTLKRALTLPHLVSGIGHTYSDEILHRARLSPVALTQDLTPEEAARLHSATRQTLWEWIHRLRQQTGENWPEKVVTFRPDMAVHGRFGKPCPVCRSPVQRLVHASLEANYCAACQTNGQVLDERSFSKLLKHDWPSHIENWE